MKPCYRVLALGSVVAALGVGSLAPTADASAPSNDDFANAAAITGVPATATGTNAEATTEAGEPNHGGELVGHSVWWNWTAPASGDVAVDTCDSNFDTLLGIYTGDSVDALDVVAQNDDADCALASRVTFSATAGTSYRIAVDGFDGATGNVELRVATLPPPAKLYLALGDSVSAGFGASAGRGFVDLYYGYLRDGAHGGLEQLTNLAVPGETSSSMRSPGGQLERALTTINERSDTSVLTLDIGGNDGAQGRCPDGFNSPPCPFSANYTAIVEALSAALADDPGDETFQVMQYHNPANGTGSVTEGIYNFGLLGSDGKFDCAGSGAQIGLNDLVACIGREHGAAAVDAYPIFKAHGQALMADSLHPNEFGHAYIACLFEHPDQAGSANPCELTPPPPVDLLAPHIGLTGLRRQHVLRRRGMSVVVRTDEDAVVTVSGRVGLPPAARILRFRRVTKTVRANTPTRIIVRPTRKGMAALRRALRVRRALRARIAVVASDAAGNSRRAGRRLKLVR